VSRFTLSLALLGALALSACAVQPPSAPSVVGLPAAGKDLSQFREDDASCRGYAAQQIAGVTETGYNLQVRYDIAYTQCMYSKGDTVRPLTQVSGYALASYIAYGSYPYYGPIFGGSVIGFAGGCCGHHHGFHHGWSGQRGSAGVAHGSGARGGGARG
jgi:hypothetical protein